MVDAYMRAIPKGNERTSVEMGDDLAKAHDAGTTCPLCCGIFLRICAEAAYEAREAGEPDDSITPFWRMIPPKAKIRAKISFPVEFVDEMRRAEGLPT